jgi:hypothetical protein
VATTPLAWSKDHGVAKHLTLTCRELVIQEMPEYCCSLLSGANRQRIEKNKYENDQQN